MYTSSTSKRSRLIWLYHVSSVHLDLREKLQFGVSYSTLRKKRMENFCTYLHNLKKIKYKTYFAYGNKQNNA